jgi:hypothetical protein
VHAWATASDQAMREDFNRAAPVDDVSRFSAQIANIAARLTRLASSVADPDRYGRMVG